MGRQDRGFRASWRRWSRAGYWCGVVAGWWLAAQTGWAATVLLKNEATPVRGYLVGEDEQSVTLRVLEANGDWRERRILRESIEIVIRPVDAARLAELDPKFPRAYRDYAEELAEKRVDPEARETAIRLYLIAAYLAPDELGRSALLGMIPLARHEPERRRFRAMAYLLDPAGDRQLLQSGSPERGGEPSGDEGAESAQVKWLLRALEMLRRGRNQEANRLIRRPGLAAVLEEHADILSWDEFTEACADRLPRAPAPPPGLVARILQVQLRLLEQESSGGPTSPASAEALSGGWESLSPEHYQGVVTELSWERLTEFDPRATVYRDGQWVVAGNE